LTNKNHHGIPKISVHWQDRPSNIIKAAAEGSFVISEKMMPHIGRLECRNIPEMRQQIVHTIRQLNREGVEKDKLATKHYRQTNYFKQKIEKIRQMPIRRLGRLEDVLDTYSEDKLKGNATA